MELSYTGQILLLMIFMIQSSIGLALSLPHLLTYSRLDMDPGQKARGIFEFFFTLAFTLNAVILFLCSVCLLVEAAVVMAEMWGRRRLDRWRREEQTETTNEYTSDFA